MCHGHWIIHWQNQPLILPESRREKIWAPGIYSVIDPEDETFAQGLQEDEWIIANVDWLTDMFFEMGIALETASYRYFTGRESSRLALHQLRWVYVN